MKFWLTDGIFHHEKTLKKDWYANIQQIYEDTGIPYEIPDDAESVIIPEGTVQIGYEAFSTYCAATSTNLKTSWKNLKKVTLPEGIQVLGDSAFYGCFALENINFPQSLIRYGSMALSGTGIRSISFSENVVEIGGMCLEGCKNLEEINLPKNNAKVSDNIILYCSNIKNFDYPDYPPDLGKMYQFMGCSSLETVHLPVGIDSIPNYTFSGCTSLKEIMIPESVTEISYEAFKDCKSLRELVIPGNVRKVYPSAFRGCDGLESIVFQRAFKGFETAFPDSKNVKRVTISNSSAGKAKAAFPSAEIYSSDGKLLYSPATEDNQSSNTKQSKEDHPSKAASSAVNGSIIPGSTVPKFVKTEYDFTVGKRAFHIVFKGAATINRMTKACLTKERVEPEEYLYDAAELIRANGYDLYMEEPHTGVWMSVLSEEYAGWGYKRKYCEPLNDKEVKKRVSSFIKSIAACLEEKTIEMILEYVPHKKNMTLFKGKVTLLTKSSCADAEGNVYALLAKNISDSELEISAKKIYIGESLYQENEAIKVIHK